MVWWLVVLTLLREANAQAKCRALSLEGGGSHGAYEAGCLQVLVENLPAEEVEWDVVSGISIGAYNTGVLSQFSKGEERAMIDLLLKYWLNFNTSSTAYKQWPGGYLEGLTIKPSLLDASPMKSYTLQFISQLPQRKASVGAINLNTGVFTNFNETLSFQDWTTAIFASGSPPFYFSPIWLQDSWWIDGGCAINMDVFTAIDRCLEIVSDESDVIVDMIYDIDGQHLNPRTEFNSWEVIQRVLKIRSVDAFHWYYSNARIAYPNAEFRYVIKPSQSMPGGLLPLDFNDPVIEWELQLGRNDTLNVLNTPNHWPFDSPSEQIRRQTYYATD